MAEDSPSIDTGALRDQLRLARTYALGYIRRRAGTPDPLFKDLIAGTTARRKPFPDEPTNDSFLFRSNHLGLPGPLRPFAVRALQ
jgi:hypothetical protein